MDVDLAISLLTILASVGMAVFASGRMVGRLESKMAQQGKDIEASLAKIKDLRHEFESSLNDGIRKDIGSIREDIASVRQQIISLQKADEQFSQACKNIQDVGEDVAYIRGIIGKTRPKHRTTEFENRGD